MKTYVVTQQDGSNDGHSIHFKGEIWKITPKLSLLTLLIWSTDHINLVVKRVFILPKVLQIWKSVLCKSVVKCLLFFLNNLKDLDPYWKMDLDL